MNKIFYTAVAAFTVIATPANAAVFFSDLTNFQIAAPGAGLIEDFEGVSGAELNTPLPSLSLASGTYTGLAGTPFPNVFVSAPGFTNFGAGNNPTSSQILTANGDESFDVMLAAPTTALGMNLFLNDLGDATITFYDSADNVLGTTTYFASADNLQFVGLVGDPGESIARFTFESTLGRSINTGIDNLYAVTAVPEPATWSFMILGFGLVGGAMRMQRKALAKSSFA
ncbi:PEPxxWA-CTERM sorting domain-containing protein [Parasphingorhabdus sp.]|uniref:PEPxxWA-CTERM sorting domain-containing protein n=1 Tax=Parasphingorhabdus sp. TaxID=2709688 RepID=UPI0032658546